MKIESKPAAAANIFLHEGNRVRRAASNRLYKKMSRKGNRVAARRQISAEIAEMTLDGFHDRNEELEAESADIQARIDELVIQQRPLDVFWNRFEYRDENGDLIDSDYGWDGDPTDVRLMEQLDRQIMDLEEQLWRLEHNISDLKAMYGVIGHHH